MNYNISGLKTSASNIKASQTKLKSAVSTISGIKTPPDFIYASKLKGLSSQISSISSNLGSIYTWMNTSISNLKRTEKANQQVVNMLNSSLSVSTLGKNKKESYLNFNLYGNTDAKNKQNINYEWGSNYFNNLFQTAPTAKKNGNTKKSLLNMTIPETLAALTKSKVGTSVKSSIKNLPETIGNAIKVAGNGIYSMVTNPDKTAASISNALAAGVKGYFQFGEAMTDFKAIVGTIVASEYTAVYDGITYLSSKDKKNWESTTKKLWKGTMSIVAKEHVESATKYFYQNTKLGKELEKNSFGIFKSDGLVTNIASGIGYTAGIALTAIFTGGGSAIATAATATASGTGKYTESYWANKRDFAKNGEEWRTLGNGLKGVGYGTVNGVWEGIQYYLGAKLSAWKGIKGQPLATSATRVGIDTGFNALDTPFRALTKAIFSNQNIGKAFKELGGWKSVIRDGLIGFIESVGGEVLNSYSAERNKGKVKTTTEEEAIEFLNKNSDLLQDMTDKDVSYFVEDWIERLKKSEINLTREDIKQVIVKYNKKVETTLDELMKKTKNIDNLDEGFVNELQKKIYKDYNDGIIDIDSFKQKSLIERVQAFQNRHPDTLIDGKRHLQTNKLIAEYHSDPIGFAKGKIEDLFGYTEKGQQAKVQGEDLRKFYNVYDKLNKEEKNIFVECLVNRKKLSEVDEKILTVFAKYGGPKLSAYSRGANVEFIPGSINQGLNSKQLSKDLEEGLKLYNLELPCGTNMYDFQTAMDKIIERAEPLVEDLVVTRKVNAIYNGGKKINPVKINENENVIGITQDFIFDDKSLLSTSLKKIESYDDREIFLEITVPKGTKAPYIQSSVYKQMGYGQQELLIGRNNIYHSTSTWIDLTTGKLNVSAELIPLEKSSIERSGIMSKPLNNTLNKYYENFRREITTEQTELGDLLERMKRKGTDARYITESKDVHKGLYANAVAEHGAEHIDDVLFFSMNIADDIGLDSRGKKLLTESAKYHDAGKGVDGSRVHGIQGAEAAKKEITNLTKSDKAIVQSAIEYHAIADNDEELIKIFEKYKVAKDDYATATIVAKILKDADALDRTRFPGNLDPEFLRTDSAKKLVKASHQLQEVKGQTFIKSIWDKTDENVKQKIETLRKMGYSDYEITFWMKYKMH